MIRYELEKQLLAQLDHLMVTVPEKDRFQVFQSLADTFQTLADECAEECEEDSDDGLTVE